MIANWISRLNILLSLTRAESPQPPAHAMAQGSFTRQAWVISVCMEGELADHDGGARYAEMRRITARSIRR